ncbi:hypothetical protein ACLD5Z_02520 [Gardnerella piotii]|uniref:hypothetical protein n=1 Tax=Gardnerella piotii TaxID=2792977 RepID=UPI003970797A
MRYAISSSFKAPMQVDSPLCTQMFMLGNVDFKNIAVGLSFIHMFDLNLKPL